MSDEQISMRDGTKGNVNLIYILYLVSIIVGVTGIVGVVLAYTGRANADPILRSHYDNQIGIFWKGLLYGIISFILVFLFIGILLMLAVLVWYIIRCVKGMQALERGEAIANPSSWGF